MWYQSSLPSTLTFLPCNGINQWAILNACRWLILGGILQGLVVTVAGGRCARGEPLGRLVWDIPANGTWTRASGVQQVSRLAPRLWDTVYVRLRT